MLYSFKNHICAPFIFLTGILLFNACSSKKEEQQILQLLQQSDSVLWQSKSQAKAYAQQAFDNAIQSKDISLQSQSLRRLANAVRVNTKLSVLLAYDSAAVATARQAKDKIALFEGLHAYAKDLLATNNVFKADTLLKEVGEIASQLKDSIYKARYLQTLGLLDFKKNNPIKAKEEYEASFLLSEKMGNQYLSAQNKVRIFQANQYLGIHDSTGKAAFEAVDYFMRNHYPEDEAYALFNIGENYRYMGNIAKAQEYYYKANELIAKQENYLTAGTFQNTIFLTMLSIGKISAAKEALTTMEKYFFRIEYTAGLGMVQNFWGQYYTASGDFILAEKAFQQADSIADVTGYMPLKAINNVYKAVLLDKQHKTKESDSLALLTYAAIQKMLPPKLIQNGHTNKDGKQYNDDEKKLMLDSNYLKDSGVVYLKKIRAQNDSAESTIYRPLLSVFDSSTAMVFNRQTADAETQYGIRIVSDSLQLQKQQTLIDKDSLKTQNIILAAVLALLLLVATGGYLQYRSRQRAVQDKQRIELLQNEIHHRVKNNLAVINRLVEVAGKNSVEDTPLAALKNRIKSIELLHNHLYSEKAAAGNIALQPYFEDLSLASAATFHSAKNIVISVDAPAEVDSAIAEKLGLIVNELVTNSYKYAFENKEAGKVSIIARQQNGMLNLQVADDGVGLPEIITRNSYGMKLIKGLSHEIKGQFSFQNNNGTRFEIAIPIIA